MSPARERGDEPPHDPLQPHSHEPNPAPPSASPTFTLTGPDGRQSAVTVAALRDLPYVEVPDCYIVSTGHGTSGPFTFGGATLFDVVNAYVRGTWQQVEVVSSDGFGTRVRRVELANAADRPVILGYAKDGRPLTRSDGLVRLIVPSERDDALRQVKWVGLVTVRAD